MQALHSKQHRLVVALRTIYRYWVLRLALTVARRKRVVQILLVILRQTAHRGGKDYGLHSTVARNPSTRRANRTRRLIHRVYHVPSAKASYGTIHATCAHTRGVLNSTLRHASTGA